MHGLRVPSSLCQKNSAGWVLTRQSTRTAFSRRLLWFVSRLETRFIQAHVLFTGIHLLKHLSAGFLPCAGLRLGVLRHFKLFWPLALVQQALPAINLQALRRLRGAVLYRSLRPSSSWGIPCWLLGLTVQSSRPAFGRRLTFVR